MVILDIKLLSGYSEDQSSLQQLENNNSVKRVDLEEGHVLIYLDELKKKDLKTFSLTLEEEESVRDLKPAAIKVYDYYQTSDEAVSDYTSPCAGVKG
ncbi:alpha-2-macroglobulin-like [Notolabrus celidotus]|uniref:alpha-2-macroglobulin-like n=1 Tax=Notolabrus celidotus TaxID=1203425 RepID=UPI0014905822|nr:alpha-2-macroglobulin-like [Notolabrus celidotus]